jgi:hypothetical protein
MFDEDLLQWFALAILLIMSVATCTLAISNYRQGNEIHAMKGKVDLISQTYIDIFAKMHERLSAAMEKDE